MTLVPDGGRMKPVGRTAAKTPYLSLWATIITAVAAIPITLRLISISSGSLSQRSVVITLATAAGCVAPLGFYWLSERFRWTVSFIVIGVVWLWWMYAFNGIALFGVSAFFSTRWIIAEKKAHDVQRR